MTLAQMPHATFPTPGLSESDGTPLAWPPTGRQIAWKPLGGFLQCPTDFLTLPWWLYREGHLPFLAVRTWYGALELRERRCDCTPDTEIHYSVDELRQLVHVPRLAPVQAALHTLENVGLLTWSASTIRCLPEPTAVRDRVLSGYQALQAQIPAWRTWVPVPRRLLRWLAREGTPGLCATAAGVLLRCLWSKGRQCISGGRVAATWIAAGFGLAERTVQRALEGLQACGWLARLPSTNADDVAQERQHGGRTVVNLAWDTPGTSALEGASEATALEVAHRRASQPKCQEVARKHSREHAVEHAVKHTVENSQTVDQNLSLIPPACDQNLSPTPHVEMPETPEKFSRCSVPSRSDLYPLQEQRPDPVPAPRARELPTGFFQNEQDEDITTAESLITPLPALTSSSPAFSEDEPPTVPTNEAPLATPFASPTPARLEDPAAAFDALSPAVQEELLQAATARLLARGLPAALLIRPALLAEVYTQMALPSLAATPGDACHAAPVVAPVVAPVSASPRQEPNAQAAAFAALPLAEQDAMLAAVTARLLAQGVRKDLLIRPLLLAEVYAQMAPPSSATSAAARRAASAPACPPRSVVPAKAPGAGMPPDLRDVVPADLRDITRLEALRQQAIRRGWLTGCDADRLNFVAAAVHARRIGATPCALFVVLVRAQRWELITQEDEDQARVLLRERHAGPAREAAASRPGLSEDARFVRGVQQILRQAGWLDDPFVAIAAKYSDWTRTRWDTALAELHAPSGRQAMERLGEVLGAED